MIYQRIFWSTNQIRVGLHGTLQNKKRKQEIKSDGAMEALSSEWYGTIQTPTINQNPLSVAWTDSAEESEMEDRLYSPPDKTNFQSEHIC